MTRETLVSATIDMQAAKRIRELIERYPDRAIRALSSGMYKEGEIIAGNAKDICPVDTGTLRDTTTVLLPKIEGDSVLQEIGSGGPAAPYAIYVHENMNAHHPVGQAKYLEQPFREAQRGLVDRLADHMKKMLGA
jgi:ribosome modulation factor